MFAIVITSSILGVLLPLILQRFHVDPAVASNPLIASIMDIYFSIAAVVLNML